jgi:catechol 2,3-dioxygenase-like lactoylglutathione lyase family enzyme
MDAEAARISAITLFVADPVRSKAFYADAFGVTVLFEDADSVAFRFDNVIVNLLRATEAGELIEPAPVGAPAAGIALLLTIPVADADAAAAELRSKGIRLLNGPTDRPWGVRTVAFADPDGHAWELAQNLA